MSVKVIVINSRKLGKTATKLLEDAEGFLVMSGMPELYEFSSLEPIPDISPAIDRVINHGPRRKRGKGNKYHDR